MYREKPPGPMFGKTAAVPAASDISRARRLQLGLIVTRLHQLDPETRLERAEAQNAAPFGPHQTIPWP